MNKEKELDHPYYDSFDEIFFEEGEELFCLNPNSGDKEVSLTEHQIYETVKFSPENNTVQIRDDEENLHWVEAELFVSCDDMDDLEDFEEN